MNAPLVSVILPTYNRAAYLPRSIGSVLGQSFADFELVVVDDGSSDDTREVVSRFADSRIRYVPRERNGGVAAARNTGVQAARGRYLAFQDSDDEWLLEKLERQMALLAPDDESSMCVCGLMRLLGTRTYQRVHGYPRAASDWARGLDHTGVLGSAVSYTQTWLVPRRSVVEAGGFNESLRIWDDWELLIRLSTRLNIRLIQEPLVLSERITDSLSIDTERFLHDMAIILRTHEKKLSEHPRARARLHHLHAQRLWRAGRTADALRILVHSLKRSPRSAATWWLLLRVLLRRPGKR